MSLLEQNIIKKDQVKKVLKLDNRNNSIEKYKVKAICNSVVYVNKLESNHLSSLYYLVM